MPCTQRNVEMQWVELSGKLERAFSVALLNLGVERAGGGYRPKGSRVSVTDCTNFGQRRHDLEGFRCRRLAKLLGRLRERNRCHDAGRARCLDRAVWSAWSPDVPWRGDWSQQLELVERLLEESRAEALDRRLRAWKEVMSQGGPKAHQWLKCKAQPLPQSLCRGDGPASSTPGQSLGLIRDHWREVWRRERPGDAAVLAAWQAEAGERHPAMPWVPLGARELHRVVLESSATAAGPSGWTVLELKSAPLLFWEEFADLLEVWFGAGFFPLAWREVLMCSIPKGKAPRADGAVDVEGLRPISVECALWRVVASAFCKRDSARRWARAWAPPAFFGALQGRDCFGGLLELDQAVNVEGYALAALDLSKAFDHVAPGPAVAMLGHFGLPVQMSRALVALWSSQARWLRWDTWVAPSPEAVGSSLPQGDAFAPLAMLACLAVPTKAVARDFPEVRQVVFVDDRALACKEVPVLLRAVEAWRGWSRALGLSENLRKLQLLPRSSAQASDFVALGWQAWVCSAVRVLGVDFARVRTSAARDTCLERWEEALRIARAIALLHVPVAVRRRFFRILCASKASWGWIFRAPAARFARPMRAVCKRISFCHPMGSPPLQQLFEGHRADPRVTAALSACTTLHRVLPTAHVAWTFRPQHGTWLGRVRLALQAWQWQEVAPFHWAHASLGNMHWTRADSPQVRARVAHLLRESWRRTLFDRFLAQPRRDALQLRFVATYSEPQVQRARALFERSDQHVRAVMVGAALSTAVYDVLSLGPGRAGVCHLCHSAQLPRGITLCGSVSTFSMCTGTFFLQMIPLLHALAGLTRPMVAGRPRHVGWLLSVRLS